MTLFVYFSITVNYSDWELMRMGITVSHAERRSLCLEDDTSDKCYWPRERGTFHGELGGLEHGIVKVV